MNAQTLPTELQAIATELQAIANVVPSKRGRPVRLSGQVKPELKNFVIDALSRGFKQADILNAALTALFKEKKEEK